MIGFIFTAYNDTYSRIVCNIVHSAHIPRYDSIEDANSPFSYNSDDLTLTFHNGVCLRMVRVNSEVHQTAWNAEHYQK